MTEQLNLVVDLEADDEKRELILQSIRQFNDSRSPWHQKVRAEGGVALDIYAYDEDKNLLGGLVGETYWGWLAIDYLWVSDAHRRNGLGSLLVIEAETIAIEKRQCRWAKVSTFSFQAPLFYQNLGYDIMGEMPNYPPGESMIWLRKELPPVTSSSNPI